jgi:hypothetical protein
MPSYSPIFRPTSIPVESAASPTASSQPIPCLRTWFQVRPRSRPARVASQYASAKPSSAMAFVMRIFCRQKTRCTFPPLRSEIIPLSGAKDLLLACSCALLFSLFTTSIAAQTLARPGWAGSGIGSESWWRNAVFYRIDVKHFQDSDGDGIGDLTGIAKRLDYLQSLGVDAIVITVAPDEPGFDDLLRSAGARQIRIVIALDHPASSAEVLGLARLWLTRGAAGISIESPLLDASSPTAAPLHELRALIHGFPGERVLLARPAAGNTQTVQGDTAQLIGQPVDFPAAIVPERFPANLKQPPAGSPPAGSLPLLESDLPDAKTPGRVANTYADDAVLSDGLQKIIAVKLLTSRGAVSLLYGQEIGIPDAPPELATMQWTPSNITPPKPEPETTTEEPAKPASPRTPENVYGGFKPYVTPKPVPKPPPTNGGVPIVDPASLPGFTTAQTPKAKNATTNVAVEDADPKSLLNFYRRLIQLHHDNPSLRSGTPDMLDHSAEKALVWVRRAPAGSRTAAAVIIACNLSDKVVTLSLDHDFTQLHLHNGSLRPLAASWTAIPQSQRSDHIVLPPYGAYIGELYH